MIEKIRTVWAKLAQIQIKKPWDIVLIALLTLLITIPLFITIHQNIIDLNWPLNLDRVLLFAVLWVVVFFILKALKKITLLFLFLYIISILFSSIFGNYGFSDVANDYNAILFSLNESPYPQDIIINKLLPFPNKSKIIKAIDYKNPKVRNFAIMSANKYFKDIKRDKTYYTLVQCFAVFKEINTKWNYVKDPKNDEYIASASESIQYLSGDCDDHSILMAACVRAIGGTPRLIHTDGHIYPEILIGTKNDLNHINFLIKTVLFPRETKGKQLHYHIDERGQIWLNLDYTAHYPGGPFMHEVILGALTLE